MKTKTRRRTKRRNVRNKRKSVSRKRTGGKKNEIIQKNIKTIVINHNKYTGEYNELDGTFVGHGTIEYANGDVYVGELDNNQRHGKGKLTYNGEYGFYEGEWRLDKKHGKGVMEVGGNFYKGDWKNDKRNGTGTMRYYDNDMYEGEWKDNKKHGKGVMKFTIRDTKGTYDDTKYITGFFYYQGVWEDDKIDYSKGGKQEYNNGDIYEGQWSSNGKRHGKGQMTFKNGNIYVGNWENDFNDGIGIMKYANGDVYEGLFKKYSYTKEGKGNMEYANDDVYDGDWKDDKREGKGTMKYANGDVYDGDWKDDKKSMNKQ